MTLACEDWLNLSKSRNLSSPFFTESCQTKEVTEVRSKFSIWFFLKIAGTSKSNVVHARTNERYVVDKNWNNNRTNTMMLTPSMLLMREKEKKKVLMILEQNKSHVVDARTKRKTWSDADARNKTYAMLLMLRQNKSHFSPIWSLSKTYELTQKKNFICLNCKKIISSIWQYFESCWLALNNQVSFQTQCLGSVMILAMFIDTQVTLYRWSDCTWSTDSAQIHFRF